MESIRGKQFRLRNEITDEVNETLYTVIME